MTSRRVTGPVFGYVASMRGTSEPDIEPDPHLARARETGGVPDGHPADRTDGDAAATTGTGESEEFVGGPPAATSATRADRCRGPGRGCVGLSGR